MARLSAPGGAGILAKTKCGSKEPQGVRGMCHPPSGALWGHKKRFADRRTLFLWSLQGMILRLPDYESGALTN